jgi:hypothetical protein
LCSGWTFAKPQPLWYQRGWHRMWEIISVHLGISRERRGASYSGVSKYTM